MSRSRTASTRPSHHANSSATSFTNPWPSANLPTWTQLFQGSFPFGWYDKATLRGQHTAQDVKVVRPDWGQANLKKRVDSGRSKSDHIIGTWLGHAGAFVEFPPLQASNGLDPSEANSESQKSTYLLFDPIFSPRAGPTQYNGVARFKPSPCEVGHLPGCDAVFISHSHYDHLDTASIKAIFKKFPNARYFVPLGIRQWLLTTIRVPPEFVIELDWWQDRELSPAALDQADVLTEAKDETQKTTLKVSCVPAQHNSGRTPADQGSTLWCGWVVERFQGSQSKASSDLLPDSQPQAPPLNRKGAIYHAGDTGYRPSSTVKSPVCPAFHSIGEKFGPIDLTFLPIWRGGSLGFISYLGLRLSHHDIPSTVHASPTDAADMHLDIKSRNTIGIHFGTFVGSANETVEARMEFAKACEDRKIAELEQEGAGDDGERHGRAGTVDIGESHVVEIV